MINNNIYQSSSRAAKTIWYFWQACGTAPVRRTWGWTTTLRCLVERLRAVWPDVHIHVRGDSNFGVPLMYDVCQKLRLSYTFGIGMNSRLGDLSDDLLKTAVEAYEKTGQPQPLFLADRYQAGSWPAPQTIATRSRRTPKGPIGEPWLRTDRAGRSCRRQCTTSTPREARARTETRNRWFTARSGFSGGGMWRIRGRPKN